MEATRRRELTHLFILFGVATLLRLVFGRTVAGPSIFTDEFQYVEMARSFPLGKGLYWDRIPTFFPNWLYPMLIAPFFNSLDWESAYRGVRAMNAILIALTVLPAYGLARELTGHRRAMAAAVLVALVPGAGYSASIMTENLFFPVFVMACWLIYRAALVPTFARCLLAGLACGLGFHVKPQGLLLPMVTAVTVLLFEADRLRGGPGQDSPRGYPLLRYVLGVGRHWATALGWLIAMAPRAWVVLAIERPGKELTIANIVGSYTGLAEGHQNYTPMDFFWSEAGYLLAWVWCVGLLPAWHLARRGWEGLRLRDDLSTRLMTILALVGTGGMLAMVSRYTLVNNPEWKLHERYFFVALPLALVLFCARAGDRTSASPLRRWSWEIVLVAVLWFTGWLIATRGYQMPTNAPTFTGPLLFLRPESNGLDWLGGEKAGWFAVLAYLVPLAAGLALLWRGPRSYAQKWAVVALIFVGCNFGFYGFQGRMGSEWRKDELNLAKKVDRKLGDDDQLLVLRDGLGRGQFWQVGMRNPGLAVYLDKKSADWWSNRLKVEPDGRVVSPVPAKDAWLLAAKIWMFDRKPDKDFGDCQLYRLDGEKPLRMNPQQLALYARAGLTSTTLTGGRPFLDSLKLTILEKTLPPAWEAGREASILIKARNDSPFAIPGGDIRLGLGYHWSDPDRRGSWQAFIWDDGRHAKLPQWVEPGQTFETSLSVKAPREPGLRYALSVKPVLLVDQGRKTEKTFRTDGGFTVRVNVVPHGELARTTETQQQAALAK